MGFKLEKDWYKVHKLYYWAGYTNSFPISVEPYIYGIMVTPKYFFQCKRNCSNYKIFLDNGAFSAWKKQKHFSYRSQRYSVISILERHYKIIDRVVTCDVVGDGFESWARSLDCIEEFSKYAMPFIPVQEDSPFHLVVDLAKKYNGGIFIGGKTWEFKRDAFIYLSHYDVPIHIGRIATEKQLDIACRYKIESFDNTTFVRSNNHKRYNDYDRRLEWYVRQLR